MIYVVIGQSGAGKTTFVKKHFLTEAMEMIENGDVIYRYTPKQ